MKNEFNNKSIKIISLQECIACEYVVDVLKKLSNNIPCEIITCNRDIANTKYKTNVFPTVIFQEEMREVARIFGTMPIDFYQTVIEKFKSL